MKKVVLAFGLAAFVGGCAVEAGSGGEPESPAEGPLVTETVVTVDAEGHEQVSVRTLTQAEADAVLAAREARAIASAAPPGAGDEHVAEAAQAITVDSGCAGADLWLQDGPSQTGNRICFAKTVATNDSTNLASYCRIWHYIYRLGGSIRVCDSTWSGAVRSYYSGSDNGTFTVNSSTQPAYFNAWERNDAPNASVTGATTVELASTCRRTLCPQSACAANETCNNGVCTIKPLAATCVNGVSTNLGGDIAYCNYYACGSDGYCKRSCTTSFDCAQGAACDTSTGLCSTVASDSNIYWMGGETNGGWTTPSQPSDSTGTCSYASCTSDASCAANEMCHNGKCMVFSQHCTPDLTGMVWWDHNTYDCGNYICSPNRGYCMSDCRTSEDCRPGFNCDGQHCI